jgi:hypothetical protein
MYSMQCKTELQIPCLPWGVEMMIPPASLIRMKAVQAGHHRRAISQIERTISELTSVADNLNREISADEGRSRNRDPEHFAYPTFAKAAIQRRNNILQTIDGLKAQLDATKNVLRGNDEELEAAGRLVESTQSPQGD